VGQGNPNIDAMEQSLPAFLPIQRWFGGKARRITAVRVVDWGLLPSAKALLAVCDVSYFDGGCELYFLPLMAKGVTACDALSDDAINTELLHLIANSHQVPTRSGIIQGVKTVAFDRLRGNADESLAVERLPATSSNSLIFYGQRLLLKVFRRLTVGVNPDYEIGRFLTEQTTFDRLPQVAGAIEYHRSHSGPITLAILQQRVHCQRDGWEYALADLKRYYEQRDFGDALSAADALGRRTAELHLALASNKADAAFAPEPITAADVAAIKDEIRTQAQKGFATLSNSINRLPETVAGDAHRLLAYGPAVLDRLTTAQTLVPTATKIRIHGDYHLGQVLWTGDDFIILDFEGEPTRTVEERRRKYSPLRDVAGMLRSYHYAAYAGLFAASQGQLTDFATREPQADRWQRDVSAAFLRAYRAAAGGADFLPTDEEEFTALLNGFMLAKALYELNYELNNRPDWVRIPLRGVLSLLSL
jgi:maltose alpha-D-glucosyltransferase/alpha-amylase